MIRTIIAASLLTLLAACVQPGRISNERPLGCDAVARYMSVDPAARAQHDYERLGGYTFVGVHRDELHFPGLEDETGKPYPEIEKFIAAHKDQDSEVFQTIEPGDVPCYRNLDEEAYRYAGTYNLAMLAIIEKAAKRP